MESGSLDWVTIVLLGIAAALLALVASLFVLWRSHRRSVDALEERLERFRMDGSGGSSGIDLPPEIKSRLPADLLQRLEDESEPLTGEFTRQIESLVDKQTADLVEYQITTRRSVIYIRSKLEKNLKASDLATSLRVTIRTLQRAVKAVLGCTPTRLILAVKMHEAKQRLRTGTQRVSEIAYELGFDNPEHFSRRFKSYYGKPPKEFVSSQE